ncbi:hypothetical protein FHS29_003395 [Saccharothrix tamanrassetensis]|uniref:Tissue inhibitor of metalloproteinase n=1 Tax=Saccharothrix tamanrassetensis TaxID=1051531 RepID=A0A841CE36_9PSEU|nr:hypothetical protein [Saccharothrix tamanrassetensis]MBB5956802.1 hypothetical protein [Saccharothrix tamanrassetensis]
MARLRFLAHAMAATTLAAGLVAAVFTGTASACSCIPGEGEPERYARADQVFTGTVLSEELEVNNPDVTYDDKYRYAVRVGREYKGDVPAQVDVLTSTSGAACGLRLSVGTGYLVFANGPTPDGAVQTHLCSGTRLASGGPPSTGPSTGPTTTTTTTLCGTSAG